MKKIYLFLLMAITIVPAFSQKIYTAQVPGSKTLAVPVTTTVNGSANAVSPTSLNPNGFIHDRCGFVTTMNMAKAGGFDQEGFETFINNKIAEMKASRTEATVNYIIPVVFHVIHDGTAEGVGANVSAAQINQQIDQLNKDFRNLSGSTFGVAANTGLSFCAVLTDPLGVALAQPGVDRLNRITKGWTDPTTYTTAQLNTLINYVNTTIKPASIWDPTKYVNIWVYNFINSGLLGYATFPTAGLPDLPGGETATTAGVVFLSGAIGSVASPGTATPYALGRTVTHELGHFFGLYHTWGDVVSCAGTDYCTDTPPCSDEYYSSVPGCTIPTQCSAMPRMIQDYMDYSDDGCMNTFTQNQVDRIQAVMLAAPRRPRNPAATLCTPAIANALRFLSDATTVAETGAVTACPRFKDYVISVAPAIAASGNATVNFTFGGTATQNVDYTIIGSTTVNYVNGETSAKSVTIRVADDKEVEVSQTIIVSYSITGTGLVAGTTNQTHTITITDDDFVNFINNTTQVTTLLSENFGTVAAGGALPTGWIKGSFLSPAGLNVWTVNALYGASTGFTAANGRALHITNALTAAQTSETATAAYTNSSASDAVAITGAINTTGYQNIKVTFDYASNGEMDVDGTYDFGLMRYSTTAQGSGLFPVYDATGNLVVFQGKTAKTTVTVTLPAAAGNVANLWIGFEWINDDNLGTNPPFIIDNIVVTGENSAVETVLNQTVTQTHNQAQSEQYMSATNKIITAITNPNSNIGCNTASISLAGVGQTDVITNLGTFKRSDKVIKITPAVPNATATYQVTLYYTTAELAIWGANVPTLKILKVADGVSLGSILTGTNAQIYTPVVNDLRATKGYVSFTANITGGFSQFMIASPTIVIPVTLLSFEARASDRNILLNWSTVTEINNKGFLVERSLNGTDFETIGWVNGKINSNQLNRYSYIDNFVQPNILYYYRLRQTDLDNREKLSDIRNAKIKNSVIVVSVSPNPAKDLLKVFVAGSISSSDMNLINAEGQTVRNWKKVTTASGPATLDIHGLAAGVYVLQVVNPESINVQKVIIK
ncbi:MAG: M43 family zinc metalloprotease [Ferruginibacter sp.]